MTHTTHETAICRYPQICSFTRDRNTLTYPLMDQHLSIFFKQKYKKQQFFCGYNNLTKGLFVSQLHSNVGISV